MDENIKILKELFESKLELMSNRIGDLESDLKELKKEPMKKKKFTRRSIKNSSRFPEFKEIAEGVLVKKQGDKLITAQILSEHMKKLDHELSVFNAGKILKHFFSDHLIMVDGIKHYKLSFYGV